MKIYLKHEVDDLSGRKQDGSNHVDACDSPRRIIIMAVDQNCWAQLSIEEFRMKLTSPYFYVLFFLFFFFFIEFFCSWWIDESFSNRSFLTNIRFSLFRLHNRKREEKQINNEIINKSLQTLLNHFFHSTQTLERSKWAVPASLFAKHPLYYCPERSGSLEIVIRKIFLINKMIN